MDKETYQMLLDIISSYYPIESIYKNSIREIVSDKIKTLEENSAFKSLGADLEVLSKVEDFSYIQFPNLKLYLEEIEDISYYRTYKNFAVCISLLGPYYTYFYEYDFRIKTQSGFLSLSKVCFLNDEKFQIVSRNLDLERIDLFIKRRFPNHSYVNHYQLAVNEIDKGLPYGEFESDKKKHSFLNYLFDSTHFTHPFC